MASKARVDKEKMHDKGNKWCLACSARGLLITCIKLRKGGWCYLFYRLHFIASKLNDAKTPPHL